MKKIVFCAMLAISSSFYSFSWSQDVLGGLLGGQSQGANNGGQATNPVGGLRGVIKEQIQNVIQPDLPGVPNTPSNVKAQAGLRAGDQIVSINGNAIGRPEDISTYMLQANNSPTTISYLRNGQYGEAFLNSSNQFDNSRQTPQSIQSKLDQIERLIGEIRAELSLSR